MNEYPKKISFLIPTNRPYETHVKNVIDSINSFNSRYDFEICVYSETEVFGHNVVWLKEEERKGPIYAFNYMATRCNGEYMICITDDHVFFRPFDDLIVFLEQNYTDEQYRICSIGVGDVCFQPGTGQKFGNKIIDFECKKYPMIRFPVLNKKTLLKLDGVIFNESFYYHAADNWLGFFLGVKGYQYHELYKMIVAHNPKSDKTHTIRDCNIARELMKRMVETGINYNFLIKDSDIS